MKLVHKGGMLQPSCLTEENCYCITLHMLSCFGLVCRLVLRWSLRNTALILSLEILFIRMIFLRLITTSNIYIKVHLRAVARGAIETRLVVPLYLEFLRVLSTGLTCNVISSSDLSPSNLVSDNISHKTRSNVGDPHGNFSRVTFPKGE